MTLWLAFLKSNRALAVLLAVFCALALFYALSIPIFEGPDEDDHFRYAKFIADQRAWPVQSFEPGGGAAGHQGWQPPLYYSLVALVIAPIDTSDYEQHLGRNYAATFVGDPSCCGRNLYYHTDSENFPYTRTTLAVHLARLLSILFGAVTVAATFLIARQLKIINDQLSIAAAALVAFNPSFLFASALVSNDAALAAFSTLTLLLWVRLLTGQSAPTLKSAARLGVLIALGALTKTTALGLIPFSMLALCLAARRARDTRFALLGNATMLAVITLVSGWWFVRNQMLYGDPLAYRLMTVSALFPRAGELTFAELFQISLPWLWQTFWGGPTPGDFAPAFLVALALLALGAMMGMVLFVVRYSPFAVRRSLLLLAAWLAFILIAQIQFIRTTTGADQGRYLFPAVSIIALFFVLGLNTLAHWLVGSLAHSRIGLLAHWHFGSLAHWLIGSFFLLALYVPFAYTLPAYARPPLLSADELGRAPNPTRIVFADRIELRGYAIESRVVKPGDILRVTLYWRAHTPMHESYRVFVHLIGAGDQFAGGVDVIPARGAFPTVYWKPGDALRDVVAVPIANAPPGKYLVEVGLYPVGKPGERLSTETGDDRAILGAVKLAPSASLAYAPRQRIEKDFAGKARLLGYDLDADSLTLYWQCLAPFDDDYTVFVHALDADGSIIAQVDREPQAGNNPTSLWLVGEQIRDEYTFALPMNATRLAIGLYRADTGARLAVDSSDHVLLDVRP